MCCPWPCPLEPSSTPMRVLPALWIEDSLRERDGIDMEVCYQRKALRRQRPEAERCKRLVRKRIESVFSAITSLFGHHIHAVTFRGFQLKLCLFLLSFTLSKAFGQ